MHLPELQRKLLAAARFQPPGDQVPYAFEHRVTALLKAARPVDPREFLARALWRGAMACVAFVLVLAPLSFVASKARSTADLSQQFESTMLAAVDQDSDNFW